MADRFDKKKEKKEISNLVTDQPGLPWSLFGLFVALLIGFSIRALISPERIRAQVEKAIQHVHTDFIFKAGDSYFSLSDGLFPEFSVVVKAITFSSENTCWMRTKGEANELRLPISISRLFKGELFVSTVEIDELSVSLRSPLIPCTQIPSASVPSVPDAGYREVSQAKARVSTRKGLIDSVLIRRLKVNYEPISFTSFEVQRFSLIMHEQAPRHVQVAGKVNLFGETLSGEYSSKADLHVDYKEGDDPKLQAVINGGWREGNYSSNIEFHPKSKEFHVKTVMAHIPLAQVFPILKKYDIMDNDFNGKQAWLSFSAESKGSAQAIARNPLRITNFRVEGDLGQIESSLIEVDSLQPLIVRPISAQLHGLDFDKLFVFLNRPHPSLALGKLGVFNGSAYLKNPKEVEIVGDHSGLEFIFSNRGIREVQIMSLISGEMQLRDEEWKVKIRQMRPLEGILEGSLNLRADRNWRDLDLDLNLDELLLSPKVQKLMTAGGEIGPTSGDIGVHFKQGQMESIKGQLKLKKFQGEGVLVQDSKFRFDTQKGMFLVDSNIREITLSVDSRAGTAIRPLIENWMLAGGVVALRSTVAKIRTNMLQSLEWTSFQSQLGTGRILSQGGWDAQGSLKGTLALRSKEKESNWLFGGDRNQPRFIPVVK